AAIESAAEVKHRRARMFGDKLSRPVIEMFGAQRQRHRGIARYLELREVVVDAAHHIVGVAIAQDRMRGATVERLAIERRKQRFLFLRQMDFDAVHKAQLRMKGAFAKCVPGRASRSESLLSSKCRETYTGSGGSE